MDSDVISMRPGNYGQRAITDFRKLFKTYNEWMFFLKVVQEVPWNDQFIREIRSTDSKMGKLTHLPLVHKLMIQPMQINMLLECSRYFQLASSLKCLTSLTITQRNIVKQSIFDYGLKIDSIKSPETLIINQQPIDMTYSTLNKRIKLNEKLTKLSNNSLQDLMRIQTMKQRIKAKVSKENDLRLRQILNQPLLDHINREKVKAEKRKIKHDEQNHVQGPVPKRIEECIKRLKLKNNCLIQSKTSLLTIKPVQPVENSININERDASNKTGYLFISFPDN